MASVWKRLQRVNKRAAKFQFTASYHELRLETTAKWRPSNLSVVWTRRSRRVASAPLPWEPDMMNPLVGQIIWPVPDNHPISVTLFKDPRTHELEDKDWTFVIEDITPLGKKRVLANASINMRKYASIESTQQSFTLTLKPVSRKITGAQLELTISCVFLREGKATDEDMQSVVSMMSVNNNCDVAPLDDLEDLPDLENDISDHLFDFTQQLEQMTTSLNGCIDVPTPLSDKPDVEWSERKPEQQVQEAEESQMRPSSSSEDNESLKTPKANPTEATTPAKQDQQQQQQSRQSIGSKLKQDFMNFSKALTSTPKQPQQQQTEQEKSVIESVKAKDTECRNNKSTTEIESISRITVTDTTGAEHAAESGKTAEPAKSTTNAKRAELTPLKLKKNYDEPPATTTTIKTTVELVTNGHAPATADNTLLRPVEKIVLKENTPGQDLLEWCKEVTKEYPNIKVTNLTTSWRNGIAFCAIIHHFVPNLVDMSKLTAHDVVGNCRTAFDAAETLGIPRVIEPRDMSLLAVPDKLAVMTYLHQLRAHFTGKQLQIEQIGSTSDESSYVIGNYKSDNLSQNLMQLSHLKAQLLHHNSLDEQLQLQPQQQQPPSPTKAQLNGNAAAVSPTQLTPRNAPKPAAVKTPSQQQEVKPPSSPTITSTPTTPTATLEPSKANKILLRHKEMSEKARMMMEKLRISTGERSEHDEERQQRLREQARRLIQETRQKSTLGTPITLNGTDSGGGLLDSPTSPTKPKRISYTPERTISPIRNGLSSEGGNGNGGTADVFTFQVDAKPEELSSLSSLSPTTKRNNSANTNKSTAAISPSHRLSERFSNGLGTISSPLQSFHAVMDRISPKNEKQRGDKLSYIESELEALEREQIAIDQKASNLEEKLRAVMAGNPSNNQTEETEEQLLSQWFTLVNKKNALLRRQMQLNILEQESDLERKYTMLNQELRAAQSVEDWRKTEVQREKERLLLEELVAIVDKRDQLVQHLHNQEIAIEDDHEIARELEQVDITGNKEKCVIQ